VDAVADGHVLLFVLDTWVTMLEFKKRIFLP
jgi:hypothetical protein